MIRTTIKLAASMLLPRMAACFVAAAVITTFPAQASIINGGFETGDLNGWSSIGDASVVTGVFGTGPASGTYQALVEGGSADVLPVNLESFLGAPAGTLDGLGNGITHGGSAISQTFTATAGQTLTFTWNFITDEVPPSIFNDFAFWSLNSSLSTLATANAATLQPFGFLQQTGAETFSMTLPSTGTYTLALGVANVSDNSGLPQLLVDDVNLTTSTPEPGSAALLALALSFGSVLVKLRRKAHIN